MLPKFSARRGRLATSFGFASVSLKGSQHRSESRGQWATERPARVAGAESAWLIEPRRRDLGGGRCGRPGIGRSRTSAHRAYKREMCCAHSPPLYRAWQATNQTPQTPNSNATPGGGHERGPRSLVSRDTQCDRTADYIHPSVSGMLTARCTAGRGAGRLCARSSAALALSACTRVR